ncbi:efflux transporter periplasmic adaptor subunit [Porphyrobacter sp. TH134]|uniref:efflux RND transporter periplasmic adaptor subunit n=1 Tax=Porphyrobacter sp. TH134 TaxID=2067450 RepID=UPI000C7E78A6|nr:efflux RND transporter periplasmic adaptor subunit [Porphyrobacter sp. TH134]PLK22605.1 efflux transporter periplasmic adaptor subunit [Porphyrobacter sp. TH134]
MLLASCSGGDDDQARKRPVPEVGYVVVAASSVPVAVELAGRIAAFEMSEVRPQVSGLIKRRLFDEGSIVRAGQTLYEIDPRLFRAATAEANANLNSARANAEATRLRAERLKPLAEAQAVGMQEYTDAVAAARQAEAAVQQVRAQVQTANVNLQFTRVPAPITGRIGRSLFTVGALVTGNQAEPLAVIQGVDPVFVDIQQSSADLLALRRSLTEGGGAVPASTSVRLILEDGTEYGPRGAVQFSEVMVNASTGTVTLRARFPNPDGLLLPGMFVRARFDQAINTGAILVPQAAVTRNARGEASVFVVDAGNKATERKVTADRAVGADWVVTSGLQPGDKVIVQGLAKIRPGAPIRPVPASKPQVIAAPKSDTKG